MPRTKTIAKKSKAFRKGNKMTSSPIPEATLAAGCWLNLSARRHNQMPPQLEKKPAANHMELPIGLIGLWGGCVAILHK